VQGDERVRKLRWKSRRGMKELDVLLSVFIGAHESALRAGRFPEIEAFLELEDDVLWDRLRQEGEGSEPQFDHLISTIRNASSTGA
jgi:succinate dehydrogenase flavin-adding protein (antitoxin of CptAB toxin-antitoxin module)